MTKYVLLYNVTVEGLEKAATHFPAHSARGDEFHARGDLLLYGPFSNPLEEGSMAVFTTREAAEEFVKAIRSC